MRAFIQCDRIDGLPVNPNVYNAFYGLRDLGFECIFFKTYQELLDHHHTRGEIISGGLEIIRKRLSDFGVPCDEINYPEELRKYLGREIWESKINYIRDHPEGWPVFIKSVEGKRLTGKVISGLKDLVGCGCCNDNYDILCSTPIDLISEWRVFVRHDTILDVRPYRGNWDVHYDPEVIKNAVRDYTSSPLAYGIDFGVTSDGRTLLIEVNDGYALGCYGLQPHLYAKFLLTRWAELTDTFDEFWYL